MVLKIPNLFVKAVTYAGVGYFAYAIYQMNKYNKQAKKLEAYKEFKKNKGENVDLDESKQKVQDYVDGHYGSKILERMTQQHLIEEQIKYTLQMKKDLRDKLVQENSEEEVKRIEEEITRMNQLYSKVHNTQKVIRDQGLIKDV